MTHIKKPASATIPQGIISISDYESAARDRMRHDIAEYIYSGSADEQTLYRNRYGFQNYPIYNRVLGDFSNADTSIQLFGKTLVHPFILAPVAHQGLVHPDGERATAMAADAMHTPMIISSLSNIPVEQITAQKGTYWFQLYWQGSRTTTLALLKKAIAAGDEVLYYLRHYAKPTSRSYLALPHALLSQARARPCMVLCRMHRELKICFGCANRPTYHYLQKASPILRMPFVL